MLLKNIITYINKFSFRNMKVLRNFHELSDHLKETPNIIKVSRCAQGNNIKIQNDKFNTTKIVMLASLWQQTDPADDIGNNLSHLVRKAMRELNNGNYAQAEDILKYSLEVANSYKLYIIWDYICNTLVTLNIVQGYRKEAENMLVNAIEQLNMWGYSSDYHGRIQFTLRLAENYSASGNDILARIGFETCLHVQRARLKGAETTNKAGLLYITILFLYSAHLIKCALYEEAKETIDMANDFANYIPGVTTKQELAMRHALADLNTEVGNLKLAINNLMSAIALANFSGSSRISLYHIKLADIYKRAEFY